MSKDYQLFINEVVAALKKHLGEQSEIKVSKITKNNGYVTYGLNIIDQKEMLIPTIYLEPYYEMHHAGVSLPEIVRKICAYNEFTKNPRIAGFDVCKFNDFNAVKERIVYKLVNTSMNQEMLQSCPHIEILDLSLVFQVVVSNQELEQVSIRIHNSHMETWGVNTRQLKEYAEVNTRRMLPEDIIDIRNIVNSLPENGVKDKMLEAVCDKVDMFQVLTNSKKLNGAATILYKDVLKNIADDVKTNLLILPSSVHECILLKETTESDYRHLKTMVQEVNEEMVAQEEVLSNHVYRYNREKDILEIAI